MSIDLPMYLPKINHRIIHRLNSIFLYIFDIRLISKRLAKKPEPKSDRVSEIAVYTVYPPSSERRKKSNKNESTKKIATKKKELGKQL